MAEIAIGMAALLACVYSSSGTQKNDRAKPVNNPTKRYAPYDKRQRVTSDTKNERAPSQKEVTNLTTTELPTTDMPTPDPTPTKPSTDEDAVPQANTKLPVAARIPDQSAPPPVKQDTTEDEYIEIDDSAFETTPDENGSI